MVDIRQLSYFVAIVEAKSFTAASDLLHVAQPALSQHIRNLESELKQQLLIRNPRGVVPTAAGLKLLEHARTILTDLKSLKDDLLGFSQEHDGVLRLGLPTSLAEIAVELFTEWKELYPNMTLQVTEEPSQTLAEKVMSGRLDMAVSSYPTTDNSLIAQPLVQDKLCAIFPGEGDGTLGEIRFPDLVKHPLILYGAHSITRQLFDMTAKYCSTGLNVPYEASQEYAIKLVDAGLGVTVQPYLSVRKYITQQRRDIRLIQSPSITRRLHFVQSRNRPLLHHCEVMRTTLARLTAKYCSGKDSARAVDFDFERY